jgi:Zn-dependent protease
MNGTIRVGNLFGIPFYVHPSWFFILALMTWSYGGGLSAQFPGLGGSLSLLLGLIASLLLFASVLAHELGHSFVAMRQGIEVKSINLFIFGGLASLEKESKTPGEAFWVAISGPLVSLVIFGLLTAFNYSTAISGPFAAVLGLLASINLALALFNLIPGLPLDGGNILKAIVWKITGNPYKGVVFAGRAGQFLGWIAISLGVLAILGISSVGSFWTLFIGLFLLQNAGRATQYAKVQDLLSSLTAADAVIPNSSSVSSELSLREFVNEYVIGKPSRDEFLVTDENGQLIGAIAVKDLNAIPTSIWPQTYVRELIKPMQLSTTVKAERSLLEVVTMLEQQKLNQIPVIRDGVLVGIVEKGSIQQLLMRQAQAKFA